LASGLCFAALSNIQKKKKRRGMQKGELKMDLEDWEVIPSINPCCNYSKALPLPLFLGPDVFVEADYFRCPATTSTPPQPQHQHQEQEEEEEEKEEETAATAAGGEVDPQADALAPTELKDISISTEFSNSNDPPPFNWLEPDPMEFDRGTDRSYDMASKEELVAQGKDCAGFNLWGLTVNGIGAICSFGVATAATLCVFALGAASTSASYSARLRPSPNIQFQIYSHDKVPILISCLLHFFPFFFFSILMFYLSFMFSSSPPTASCYTLNYQTTFSSKLEFFVIKCKIS
jgi:hypothetical protein